MVIRKGKKTKKKKGKKGKAEKKDKADGMTQNLFKEMLEKNKAIANKTKKTKYATEENA